LPSAHSPSRSRPRRQEAWPTAETLLFTGADLEEAVAAAAEQLGDDVDVRAARSVKQGLRGKTHVEVLVARPTRRSSGAGTPPPLPPSERPHESGVKRSGGPRRERHDDPVESTLAALLASADAEEDEYRRSATAEHSSSVMPFEPPQLTGNPTFAAEFAAAFPAALAAARAAEEEHPTRVDRAAAVPPTEDPDFTARVREALRRVPEESSDEDPAAAVSFSPLDWNAEETEELEVIRPESSVSTDAPRAALVPARSVQPAPAATRHPHPAIELIDEPPRHPMPGRSPSPSSEQPAGGGRSRPSPGPLAAAGRPAALRRPTGSGWSTARLRDLGVPDPVLQALPTDEPTDDLRWLVALTDAITATVPAPAEDGSAVVTASGTGLRGALALLRLGLEGVAPQTLTVEGRALPATATELALAIRAGILR
jgi:hypothetical protein